MHSCRLTRAAFVAALLFALMAAATGPVWAQGQLNSVSFRPFDKGTGIAVRAWDDSPQNLDLQRKIETILTGAGYRLSDKSPVTLSFSTRSVLGSYDPGTRQGRLSIEGHGGRTGTEQAQVLLNLYSSSAREQGEAPANRPTSHVLEMTLDEQNRGRLWQGEAAATFGGRAREEVYSALLRPLLDSLGQTVRSQKFEIQ